jgi:hypothetical protein
MPHHNVDPGRVFGGLAGAYLKGRLDCHRAGYRKAQAAFGAVEYQARLCLRRFAGEDHNADRIALAA